ncbi:hypothetical protein GTH50_06295 [Lactobacillus gasseri]|uniref:hypothetical protein n=1 Tax=Lactobacillus gasseri TaxID=1596 RepID=UPI0011829591|nr:hypothetical protein [Lactobacillus gasseri]MYM17833.1 hypothetical protein [Lactobacillus gasseri]
MRRILNSIGSEERHTFQANFGKYGYKRYHDPIRGELYSPTMVVRNLEMVDDPENPQLISDHLWLNLTKGFKDLGLLKEGDRIQFNGRVSEYSKCFIKKDKKDYELTYPSKAQLLTDRNTQKLPDDHQVLIGMIMNLNYKFYNNLGRPLVPYFMDAFAKWQEEQETPLPIKCHKGNEYESSSKYDALDYKEEKDAYDQERQKREDKRLKKQAAGLKLLQTKSDLVDDLISLGKKLKAEAQDESLKEYCYISNSKLSKVLIQHKIEKAKQANIRQALNSEWFHEKFDDQNGKELSPLEQLANKFNQN